MVSFKSTLFAALAVFFMTETQYMFVLADDKGADAAGGEQGTVAKPAEEKKDPEAEKRANAAKKTDDAVMAQLARMLHRDGVPNAYDAFDAIVQKCFAKLDQEKDKDFIADNKKELAELKDKLYKDIVALKNRPAQRQAQAKENKEAKEGEDVKEPKDLVNDIADRLNEIKEIVDKVSDKALGALKGNDKNDFEHELFKVKAKFVNDKCEAIAKLFDEAGNEVGNENIKKLLNDLGAHRAEVNKHKLEVDRAGDGVDPVKNFKNFKDEAKKHGEKAAEVVDELVKFRKDNNVEFEQEFYDNVKEFVDVVISTSKAYFPALAITLLLSAFLL